MGELRKTNLYLRRIPTQVDLSLAMKGVNKKAAHAVRPLLKSSIRLVEFDNACQANVCSSAAIGKGLIT